MTGLADGFAALMQIRRTLILIQRECSLHALTGHWSADGLQCLFSSHMTPLTSLPNLHSASWTSFLPTHTPIRDRDTYCVFLWCSDWTGVVPPTKSPKVCRCLKQTGLWHLEWAGIDQLWLTNWDWQGHVLQSLSTYWTKHINGGRELMQHRLLLSDLNISDPGTWSVSVCRPFKSTAT